MSLYFTYYLRYLLLSIKQPKEFMKSMFYTPLLAILFLIYSNHNINAMSENNEPTAHAAVFKILRQDEWKDFKNKGYFIGNSDDIRDGFIHLSPKEQVQRIIKKYFANDRPLFVVKYTDLNFLKMLRWELSNSGDLYPHLYNTPLYLHEINDIIVIKN